MLALETRVRAQILAFQTKIAMTVTFLLRTNACSCPLPVINKEKKDSKKASNTPKNDSDSSSLIDPSLVTVVGAVDDQDAAIPWFELK